MDAATQTRMTVTDFGEALIRTRDLDPVYCAIHGAGLPRDQLCRLLLSYLCFYHLGASAHISEETGYPYWAMMDVAAANELPPLVDVAQRWPRAAERRHFRGQKCVDAVGWLKREFERPEAPVEHLMLTNLVGSEGGLTEKVVMERIECWPMFGPWVSFKAADMMERVVGVPVQFDHDLGLMYEEPRKGLEMLRGDPTTNYNELLNHFSIYPAPPACDRPCGPQEVETVLCKWKSHMNGHYPVGKDIREVRHALHGWGETAGRLLAACPEDVAHV